MDPCCESRGRRRWRVVHVGTAIGSPMPDGRSSDRCWFNLLQSDQRGLPPRSRSRRSPREPRSPALLRALAQTNARAALREHLSKACHSSPRGP
jgi:hypothetical protein